MRFPKPIIDHLKAKGIHKPTPIQVQGIPSVYGLFSSFFVLFFFLFLF